MDAKKFIGQSNLYSRTNAVKQRSTEVELYAAWLLARIELCLKGIATMQALSGDHTCLALSLDQQNKFAIIGSRATLESLRDAVQELCVKIEVAVDKLAKLNDIAIDPAAPIETDVLIEAAVVIAEESVETASRTLFRVDTQVRALSADIRTSLCTFFGRRRNERPP